LVIGGARALQNSRQRAHDWSINQMLQLVITTRFNSTTVLQPVVLRTVAGHYNPRVRIKFTIIAICVLI
jgi:hypothetical protein